MAGSITGPGVEDESEYESTCTSRPNKSSTGTTTGIRLQGMKGYESCTQNTFTGNTKSFMYNNATAGKCRPKDWREKKISKGNSYPSVAGDGRVTRRGRLVVVTLDD